MCTEWFKAVCCGLALACLTVLAEPAAHVEPAVSGAVASPSAAGGGGPGDFLRRHHRFYSYDLVLLRLGLVHVTPATGIVEAGLYNDYYPGYSGHFSWPNYLLQAGAVNRHGNPLICAGVCNDNILSGGMAVGCINRHSGLSCGLVGVQCSGVQLHLANHGSSGLQFGLLNQASERNNPLWQLGLLNVAAAGRGGLGVGQLGLVNIAGHAGDDWPVGLCSISPVWNNRVALQSCFCLIHLSADFPYIRPLPFLWNACMRLAGF